LQIVDVNLTSFDPPKAMIASVVLGIYGQGLIIWRIDSDA